MVGLGGVYRINELGFMQASQWYVWNPFNLGDVENVTCIMCSHLVTLYAACISIAAEPLNRTLFHKTMKLFTQIVLLVT